MLNKISKLSYLPPAGRAELSGLPLSIDSRDLPLTVLGADEFTVTCSPEALVARRLIVRLSARVQQSACVAIGSGDALLLGEVLGCWEQGSDIWGAINIQEALVGIAHLRSNWVTKDCVVEGRQSAPAAASTCA
jgi:hypothetical protein